LPDGQRIEVRIPGNNGVRGGFDETILSTPGQTLGHS
jgi:hypothetical protein